MGKAELLTLIEVERAQMPGLQASLLITRSTGGLAGYPDVIKQSLALDSAGHRRLWTELIYEASPSELDTVVNAEDGVEVLLAHPLVAFASVSQVPEAIGAGAPIAWRSELLWFMRWFPSGGAASGAHAGDLVELLGRDTSQVLDALEDVDGVSCVVVEIVRPDGSVAERLWLDPTHGWLPRLQRTYGGSMDDVLLERRVTSFLEGPGGGVVPASGTLSAKGDPDGPLARDTTQTFSVVADGAWCWPAEIGTASMAGFSSVRELVPGDWTMVDARADGVATLRLVEANQPSHQAGVSSSGSGVGAWADHRRRWIGLALSALGAMTLIGLGARRRAAAEPSSRPTG